MGHLGHLREEYRALVGRLQASTVGLPEPEDPRARTAWQEILEIMYTPEEAALAARLPVQPTALEPLARRLGMPPGELRARLEPMCDKGIVMDIVSPRTGRAKYLLSPPVVGFFEFSMMRRHDGIPKRRMAEALEAYTNGDEAFAREVFGGETVVGRALVNEQELDGELVPDVLDWERATAIIDGSRSCAVSICYCRHKAEHLGHACDAPQEICLSFDAGADFVVRRGFGKAIDRADARAIMQDARKSGLVQIADNVRGRPTYICNCCGCCCGQLQSINRWSLPAVNPSGFLACSDPEKCSGCSRCSRACPIAVITMRPERSAAKRNNDLLPVIDASRCIGCGVCANACKKDAMRMVRRAERPHVPRDAVERSLRMALERGHLGDLVAVESEQRGVKFLGQVVRALLALPPAQRALASSQLRSRFVRAVLGRVEDPSA